LIAFLLISRPSIVEGDGVAFPRFSHGSIQRTLNLGPIHHGAEWETLRNGSFRSDDA
jgi:hypothetical protein